MKDTLYLVANRRGVTKMTKRAPDLAGGEIAVRVTVEIPSEHFRDPYLAATIRADERHLIQPEAEVELEVPQ